LLTQLATPDRYQAQAAIAALSQRQDLERWSLGDCPTAAAKTGLLAAWRFRQLDQPESLPHDRQDALIRGGLASAAPEPLMLAIRWAAERQSVELLPQIEQVLERPDISPELFQVAVAAVSYLKQGTAKRGVRDPAQEQLLYELAAESAREDKIRALAVQMIPADAAKPSDAEAVDWVTASQSVFLQRELVLLLDERNTESAHQALAQLAAETALPGTIRADAVASLADRKSRYREAMESLLEENPPAELRREARRVLRGAEAVKREAAPPAAEDLAAWMKRVGSGGDPAAGRRVFRRAACVTCHQHSGRGATTGPDLTTLAGQSRQRILKSILQPSAEIGPLYVPWKILTVDGEVLVGLKNARPGPNRSLSFQAADGSDFFVGLDEVEYHSLSDVSIMPAGLEETMRVDELRDLLAFLEAVEDTGAASVSSPR
jgi:putative heme-binding domain-containing protein